MIFWLLGNSAFAYVLDALDFSGQLYSVYIYFVCIGGIAVIAIKFIGGFLYLFPSKHSNFFFDNREAQRQKDISGHIDNLVVPHS